MLDFSAYQEAAAVIKGKLGDFNPEVLVILGTGVGYLAEEVENAIVIPYKDVPYHRVSTAHSHKGNYVFGKLAGKDVMVMQGRVHIYEGYSAEEVTFPVRVAKLLGCDTMIVTNAAGAVNYNYRPGDIMLISDQIRLFDPNPLIGPNIEEFGGRFCDMTDVYTSELREMALETANEMGIQLKEGVYFYFTGPQFETPAEIRACRALGGDAVGMSTVPEAIAAVHCQMKILGFSLMVNMASGMVKKAYVPGEAEAHANRVKDNFCGLVKNCLAKL